MPILGTLDILKKGLCFNLGTLGTTYDTTIMYESDYCCNIDSGRKLMLSTSLFTCPHLFTVLEQNRHSSSY